MQLYCESYPEELYKVWARIKIYGFFQVKFESSEKLNLLPFEV